MAPVAQTVSRRTFLSRVGAATSTLALEPPLMEPGRFANNAPVRLAMHVHASFSEGDTLLPVPCIATMHQQVFRAMQSLVDIIWWIEHDWRMSGYKYREEVHF